MKCLIGHTGFVGSNINRQENFDFCYNSQNIEEIKGRSFDLLICAGARGVKWKANKFPDDDFREITRLIQNIDKAKFKKLVLISTIAVCSDSVDDAYGRNRLYLETHLRSKYECTTVVRLPALFGEGLKKNAIYDLINQNYEYLPSLDSQFQYYCLDNIWQDIQVVLRNNITVMNISPEPTPFCDVFDLFDIENVSRTEGTTVVENMKTEHAHFWGKDGDYIYSRAETMTDLKNFIAQQRNHETTRIL